MIWRDMKSFVDSIYGPDDQVQKIIVPFEYPITFQGLAPGGTQTSLLAITANASFVHMRTNFSAYKTAVADVNNVVDPAVRIMVQDTGTQEQYMQGPVMLANYCQSGSQSSDIYNTYPRIISGNSSLIITLTAPETLVTYALIEVAFVGALVRTL